MKAFKHYTRTHFTNMPSMLLRVAKTQEKPLAASRKRLLRQRYWHRPRKRCCGPTQTCSPRRGPPLRCCQPLPSPNGISASRSAMAATATLHLFLAVGQCSGPSVSCCCPQVCWPAAPLRWSGPKWTSSPHRATSQPPSPLVP